MGSQLRVTSTGPSAADGAPAPSRVRPTSFAERLTPPQTETASTRSVSGRDVVARATTESESSLTAELLRSQEENVALLKLQIQESNQDTEKISNVLKTRHDTLKNSIANIR